MHMRMRECIIYTVYVYCLLYCWMDTFTLYTGVIHTIQLHIAKQCIKQWICTQCTLYSNVLCFLCAYHHIPWVYAHRTHDIESKLKKKKTKSKFIPGVKRKHFYRYTPYPIHTKQILQRAFLACSRGHLQDKWLCELCVCVCDTRWMLGSVFIFVQRKINIH